MLIVCPTCASEYNVEAGHLGSEGRRVRCFNCNTDWFAQPTSDASGVKNNPLKGRSAQDFINDEWQRAEDDGVGSDYATSQQAPEDDNPVVQDQEAQHHVPSQSVDASEQPQSDVVNASADNVFLPGTDQVSKSGQVSEHVRRKKAGSTSRSKELKSVRKGPRPIAGALAIFGALLLVACIWQRDILVRYAPALAGPFEKIGLAVNIRGLEFDKSASELVNDPSGRFLVVQGVVRNVTSRHVAVPQIEIVVRDAMNKPVYTWAVEPPKNVLAAGETLSFRTRLAAPPQDGHDVMLRFQRNSGQMKLAQK